jgi:NAD(P)H dehydrogenase (quinone)
MHVLIIHAHPEPKSFSGALTAEAQRFLIAHGHEVVVSDLYAMRFSPVSDRRNFTTVRNADYFSQQEEEAYAAQHDGFAADIKCEMEKLFWCDVLIWQFPLWWCGLPAILKGWVDRVFAAGGRVYGGGKWYDRGVFAAKRAMCSLTIGGSVEMYAENGLNGSISTILFPIHHGMLYFTGFKVIEPFLVHAPVRMSQIEREAHLARYRERLLQLRAAPTLSFPKLADYDEQFVLKRAVR